MSNQRLRRGTEGDSINFQFLIQKQKRKSGKVLLRHWILDVNKGLTKEM
jgi:hypothetical protein